MDTLILTSGGIGDQILGLQCALAAKKNRPNVEIEVISISRDEVFEPLYFLFKDCGILLTQHLEKEKWGENNWILKNQNALREYPHKNKYYVVPDLLYRNPLAFDCHRFGLHMSTIRESRWLTSKWQPGSQMIYLGLNTTTPEYKYSYTKNLIERLSKTLPNYSIYFNDVRSWAGHIIDNGIKEAHFDLNVYILNHSFKESLEWLMKSDYVICLDNGISHIAYQLGIPRLLLSKRLDGQGLMWLARWYPSLADCLPYEVSPLDIAQVVKDNLEVPQTTLIPRSVVVGHHGLNWGNVFWDNVLGFKY